MKRTKAGDIFTEAVTNGLLLGALLEQFGTSMTTPDGQSGARWKVLGTISKQEMTVADVSRVLKQSRQAVQKIADSLDTDGLAKYLDNPADRRAKLLTLTHRGREILLRIQARQIQWANDTAKRLPVHKWVEINAALQELVEVLGEDT